MIAGASAYTLHDAFRDRPEEHEIPPASLEPVSIVEFGNDGQRIGSKRGPKVWKPTAEWRKQLSAAAFQVTRRRGTEAAYTGRYWNSHAKAVYRCICCSNALFRSEDKFESGTGWPSFTAPIAPENVFTRVDTSFGIRQEVLCSLCDAHLGHVFSDGPPPNFLRYCMNSVALTVA